MKRLFKKLFIVFFIPVVIWVIYIFGFPLYYMDDEYPVWQQQKDYLTESNEYNQVIILGDSIAKSSINPKYMKNITAYNLALGGATSVEMYTTLKNYLLNHDAPQTVIIIFNPMEYVENRNFFIRTMYFNYYSVPELMEIYKDGKNINDPIWISEDIEITILQYYLKFPQKYLPAVNNSNFFGRYNLNVQIQKQLINDRGWMHYANEDGDYGPSYIEELNDFNIMPMQDLYMHKIIQLCNEHEIKVIVEQNAIKNSSNGKLDENFIAEYKKYFTDLQNDYPDITVCTLDHYYDNIYFGDANHLNEKGTEKYTKEFYEKYFSDGSSS